MLQWCDDHYFIVMITLLLFLVRAHQHNSNSLSLLFCLFHSICCVKLHSFTSVFFSFFSSSSLRSFLSCITVLCVGLLWHKLAYFCSLFFCSPLPRVVSHALTCEHLGPTSPPPDLFFSCATVRLCRRFCPSFSFFLLFF